ncbi:hypothetical protein FA09DRAFT_329176 [Tilletiopsis washingtonensis]|uniref:BHLH domain-containing protein n=1 Tax=Tilletiopsis washingtonensis TaxID=58919 RepID=A0A316ZAF2_9BASI|nr:hypothetical protein FA09DRAFT_329176 [Tilletiopsis washingtonensis]PWN98660.1 hypothetical protein FA09DRAFT_329176 [Tilletiopsis washingtonensis]
MALHASPSLDAALIHSAGAAAAPGSSQSSSSSSSRTAAPHAAADAFTTHGAAEAFGLPAMPVPYEDFHFSLDLPHDLQHTDLRMLQHDGEFQGLLASLGGGGGAASSSSHPAGDAHPAHDPLGIFSASSSSAATLAARPFSSDEPMSYALSRAASTQGSSVGGGTGGAGVSSPGPSSSLFASSAFFSLAPTPPPLPSQAPLFSFDDLLSRSDPALAPSPSGFSAVGIGGVHDVASHHGAAAGASSSLFDANEATFLSNFLENFESSWDFNPALPSNMPSFADATAAAAAALSPTGKQRTRGEERGEEAWEKGRKRSGNVGGGGGGGEMQVDEEEQRTPKGERKKAGKKAASRGKKGVAAQQATVEEKEDSDDSERGGSTPHADVSSHSSAAAAAAAAAAATEALAAEEAAAAAKRELLSEGEKRANHILSEQRRRNHIRESFKDLVVLLEAGRAFGARGLGLASGAGTGIEDEGLDDRSEEDVRPSEDDEVSRAKRKKARARRTQPGRGRGKGRGRGGSAGGGAGSKSAVLFQAVDLLKWIEGKNAELERTIEQLEEAVAA